MAEDTPRKTSQGYRTYVLILLMLVYTFNFVDRQIIGILSPFIKEDLGLSDSQLGFLKGFAFALFYTIVGIPIAWLADRYNRVTIVSISLALWSGFTAASGLAVNYTQLALARIGVGVGEAGGSPPSHSMISDLYPPEKRAGALAIYSLGIPFGIMIAYFSTAAIIHFTMTGVISSDTSPWRTVLIWLGIPGVVFALLLKVTVREPQRQIVVASKTTSKSGQSNLLKEPSFIATLVSFSAIIVGLIFSIILVPGISDIKIGGYKLMTLLSGIGLIAFFASLYVLIWVRNALPDIKMLLSIPSWWGMCMGIALASFASYALSGWVFDYFKRAYPDANFIRLLVIFGICNGTVYALGTILGGRIADKWGEKNKGAYALLPAILHIVGVPCFIASFWIMNINVILILLSVYLFVAGTYLGPSFSMAQTLAPVRVRAMSTALFFFILNMIALGGGPTYIGILSEALTETHGETHALRLAMTTLVVPFALSILAFFWTSRRLPGDLAKAATLNESA